MDMSAQGVSLVASVSALVGMLAAQPPARSSLGTFPVPEIVGMSGGCEGFVLATGPVDAADHESEEGYFNVGGVALSARPNSAAMMRLRTERGKSYDLVLRPIPSRDLQRVER
jgi:hypothetical protein